MEMDRIAFSFPISCTFACITHSMTVSENLRQLEAVPSVEFARMPDVWNKENEQQVQQEEGEGKEEDANGLNEQVEHEGEFYEGVHDNE